MRLCGWRWRPGTSEAAKVKQARGVWSISVAARVRQQPRTRLTPIVMLTSSSLPIDVTRAFEAGANSYVAKPVDSERLLEAVVGMAHYWLRDSLRPPRD